MYQGGERKNRTNLFVRQCITEALFALLEKQDFDSITITDIIKKAGVSRMGFYRNFADKKSVIEAFILDKFVETVNDIRSKRELNFQISSIMLTTLQNFQKFSRYIKLFLDKNLDSLLYDCYHKAFYSLYGDRRQSQIRQYANEMFIGELFNLEMCWVRNGMKETPEQLADVYYRIMKLRSRKNFDIR